MVFFFFWFCFLIVSHAAFFRRHLNTWPVSTKERKWWCNAPCFIISYVWGIVKRALSGGGLCVYDALGDVGLGPILIRKRILNKCIKQISGIYAYCGLIVQ